MLLYAQAVHVIGDTAVAAALAETLFFDVPVGEARLQVALYLALAFAPYALLSPLATRVLARGRRTYGATIAASDVARALLAALLAGRLDGPWLYPAGFAVLVLSRLHGVARHSLMPRLVGAGGDLLQANAAVSLVSAAAGVAGGATGVALARMVSASAALGLAAVAFAAGALSALWFDPPRWTASSGRPPAPSWLGDGSLRPSVVVLVSARAALGFTSMLLAFTFHGNGPVELLLALGTLGAGSSAAPLAVRFLRRRVGGNLPPFAVAALVVPAAAAVVLRGLPAVVILAFGVGFLVALARMGFDALAQDAQRGREIGLAYARYEVALQLGWVAGAAAGSLFSLSLPAGGFVLAALALAGLAGGKMAQARGKPEPQPH